MRPVLCLSTLALIAGFAAATAGGCSSSSSNKDGAAGAGAAGAGAIAGSSGGRGGSAGAAGGSAGSTAVDGSLADSAASVQLTSTAFTEGNTIPAVNTCAGANTSPQLAWTAGPSGTMSYAVILTDLNNAFVHWAIWDIPAGTRELPANLPVANTLTTPVMATQVHFQFAPAGEGGYFGPCPSGNLHTYEFEVHAIDVATLPGVSTTSMTTDVKTAALAHGIAHGDLNGTSAASRPADGGGQ